jgi:hypothetical protein
MDMKQFELTDSAVFFQLKHPVTRVPLQDDKGPVGVRILGQDSEEFKRHQRQIANKGLEAAMRRGGAKPTAEELEHDANTTLSACIKELVNISWDGEALSAPADTLRMFELMPWAKEQIDSAIADRTLFIKASHKG